MKPTVLFRRDFNLEEEWNALLKHFPDAQSSRTQCRDSLVIGRYSVLPYYRELEVDLANVSSKLINTYKQHLWIADFQYYEQLQDYTFKTWLLEDFAYVKDHGPFVVRGKTNSRKFDWKTKMFAQNKADAIRIGSELFSDSLIGSQGIIVRKYEKLRDVEKGVNDLPFTNEWRFFFLGGELVSYGYYWPIVNDLRSIPSFDPKSLELAREISGIAKDYANFFVLDLAQKENGDWILVEVNDGQMSGLCTIEPDVFYASLKEVLENITKLNLP